jgi:O-antigen/teichoic acid export membrane protein
VKAAADGSMLPVIVFSVLFGIALARVTPERRDALLRVAQGVADAMQQLVVAISGTVFIWTASSYRPSLRFSIPHLRDLMVVSISIFASTLLWFFSTRVDQIVIGRQAGVLALGLYVVAGKIPDLVASMTQQPLKEVTLPLLSQLQNDRGRMRQAIYSGMELNSTVAFAIFVGMALTASDFVPLMFGSKWAGQS